MMAEYICYGVLYIAEATIAWLYFDALFCRKSSGLKIGITFAVAYLLLFGITWFNSVVLNGAAFFLANLLLLWMNYECKLRSAILHSAFLTSIMAITEIIAAWIISLFGFRFGAYADSLAIMIVMAVISKMLYFSITVIAAKLWAPNRQAQEEPAFMGLLCILPIFSYFRGQNASLQRRDIGLLYVQCSSAPHHEFRDCAFSFETSPHDPAQVVCRRN